jgi:hypothetical protein
MEQQEVSRFQERIALIVGGATLLSLEIRKDRPPWGGVVLVGMGLLLLRSGLRWIQSLNPHPMQAGATVRHRD